ncbi:hypothetical protein BKA66DRAFT_415843 [Pyrenochaeta sp. MPI-SDFR-AT-0127]|nr:hypothetical protein BKA66DRAFT_415843 [Pyrenochaeta sp. MPI-SDFR-AT-0127]
MYDLPAEFSSAQLEARTILIHILNEMKDTESKYFPRYGKWVQRHPGLEKFCFQCVRPQVWAFLQGRWSLDSLKAISGDLKFEGRAVYLNGVLGLDRRVRIYIGQATCLRQRVAQHLNFRYRRDNPSLHYHAMQYSIYNTIGSVALLPSPGMGSHALPGMDQPELLLNVLETWMCLMFRTLPSQTLEEWLCGVEGVDKKRKEGKEGVFTGLNIVNPVQQGGDVRKWLDLNGSDDPLVLEYLALGKAGKSDAEQRKHSDIPYVKKYEEQDTPAEVQKRYIKAARQRMSQEQYEIRVPGWVLVSGLALALGIVLFNSSGGPQPKPRLRFR